MMLPTPDKRTPNPDHHRTTSPEARTPWYSVRIFTKCIRNAGVDIILSSDMHVFGGLS